MKTTDLCECCMTNNKKSLQAKYCDSCSEYICNTILYRTYRIDLRYKKIWKAMFEKMQKLSEEERFMPKQLKGMLDEEGVDHSTIEQE